MFDQADQRLALAVIVGLSALSESFAVRLHHEGRVSISVVGVVVAAVMLGPLGAVITALAVSVTSWAVYSRHDLPKLAFNWGQLTVAAAVGAVTAEGVNAIPQPDDSVSSLVAGLAASLAMFAVSSGAVSLALSLATQRSFRETYGANFIWLIPHYAAFGAVGGGLAVAYDRLGLAPAMVVALPLVLSRYSLKQVLEKTRDNVLRLEKSNQQLQGAYVEIRKISDELDSAYTGTLESLVAALDVRDQETRGHSQRVARHSAEMAKLLGINEPEEMMTIYRGALMHDVGKIGVPDNILLKPGALTDEEWVFMKRHSAMGYKILAQVPYLRPTARIVLAHHERWDGGGYPRRLKSHDIPLGARIFALADTYDAIISDRPYRKGRTPMAAFEEILRCSGSQFDPKVVEAFEALFPEWKLEDSHNTRPPLYLPTLRQRSDPLSRSQAAG
ncbi:MAG: HD-GYP domain-containing protein [Dehalococcoidia bacterium]